MPEYPPAEQSIVTDMILFDSDLAACENADLLIRTVFEPGTSTCAVYVFVRERDGLVGKQLASRTIFQGVSKGGSDET